MADVTQILAAIEAGDPSAAAELLPLVYDELRKLAAARMADESPDHTLQPTALVHEAYLRLVGTDAASHWNSRGHFFGAAAEAMRRILVENARRKRAVKHGGGRGRVPLVDADLTVDPARHEVRRDDGAVIDLTPVEFRLLSAILGADGRVLSRDQLLDAVYGHEASEVLDRTIDVHIRRLRDKLDDDPDQPRYVQTVRGIGYRSART